MVAKVGPKAGKLSSHCTAQRPRSKHHGTPRKSCTRALPVDALRCGLHAALYDTETSAKPTVNATEDANRVVLVGGFVADEVGFGAGLRFEEAVQNLPRPGFDGAPFVGVGWAGATCDFIEGLSFGGGPLLGREACLAGIQFGVECAGDGHGAVRGRGVVDVIRGGHQSARPQHDCCRELPQATLAPQGLAERHWAEGAFTIHRPAQILVESLLETVVAIPEDAETFVEPLPQTAPPLTMRLPGSATFAPCQQHALLSQRRAKACGHCHERVEHGAEAGEHGGHPVAVQDLRHAAACSALDAVQHLSQLAVAQHAFRQCPGLFGQLAQTYGIGAGDHAQAILGRDGLPKHLAVHHAEIDQAQELGHSLLNLDPVSNPLLTQHPGALEFAVENFATFALPGFVEFVGQLQTFVRR